MISRNLTPIMMRIYFIICIALCAYGPFVSSVNAQFFHAIYESNGYYCIKFPDGSMELGQHVGGGEVGVLDYSTASNDIAKKAARARRKLRAVNQFINTKGNKNKLFKKLFNRESIPIKKAKKLRAKLKLELKAHERVIAQFEECRDQKLDFTGAGELQSLFAFPAPNDLPSRNYNILYLPLKVTRTKKGKVKTNLKFCLSYVKYEGPFKEDFKLAPYEYIVTFYNDPCLAGRLSGASCPNFFGGRDDYGRIIAVLNGIGPDPNYGWDAKARSEITVTAHPMPKIGCLGEDGFRTK